MLENADKREPTDQVDEGKPSGTHSLFEFQNVDTEKSLMNAVDTSFICSFCLVWQLIYSGKSTGKEENSAAPVPVLVPQR